MSLSTPAPIQSPMPWAPRGFASSPSSPMSADALGTAEAVLSRQRRIGLRVALAVATGLTWNVATCAIIPFFGPVLAVQFLILGAGPLPLSKAVAFVGLVLVVGQGFISINGLFGDHPIQLLMLLGFFYFV